ncbi:uncharacterized protein LOC21409054 [Morus notabilis]|uniref:uncharacterized protein LOC21409054 n=1 Tax=Morus notabilis TaxID=981085 RepID=UPI000CECEF85|nr:uncharacterized protein LOC21409054 [Morus notabilis]
MFIFVTLAFMDAALDDARSINDTDTSIAGPSCAVIESNCSEIAAVNTELPTAADVTVNSVSQGTESLDFQAPNFGVIELNCSDIVAVNAELLTVADDTLDSESHGAEALDFQAQTNEADLNGKHLCVKDSETDKDHSSAIIQSPKTASLFSPQKRKPYHGWISNDEEDDFMYLMPEPLPEALKKCLRLNKKRIQRWDLRPEDVYGSHLSPAPPCS